jgi:hypothetical protein
MAWNHIGSSPIPAVTIPEASLAALTVNGFYAIGPTGLLLGPLPSNPSTLTWANLRSVGASVGNGYYAAPLDADVLVQTLTQLGGSTLMAGSVFMVSMLSSVPLLAGYGPGSTALSNPGSDQATAANDAGVVLGATGNQLVKWFTIRPGTTSVVGSGQVSRLWMPVLQLTTLPTGGQALTVEYSYM